MPEDCANVASMAKPFVCPVGHHIDVARYILMGHAVEHIADGRCRLADTHLAHHETVPIPRITLLGPSLHYMVGDATHHLRNNRLPAQLPVSISLAVDAARPGRNV